MKIRTISQLEQVEDLKDGTLFGVSTPVEDQTGAYISNSVLFSTIKGQIEQNVATEIASRYQLDASGGQPIDVSKLEERVETLESKECNIYGTKTFRTAPKIISAKEEDLADNNVPTVGQVKSLVLNNGDYITDEMIVVGQPGNNARYTVFDRNFMHWKIGENQTDSSEYIDTTGYPVGPKVCTHTGNLVIYGWLADNGDVDPQDAWVGLYGCLHTNADDDNERDWVLLQLQPWPLTAKSSVFQYVGFNVKVAKGMKLKIKTGFRVKGKNSGFQGGSTLTYWTNQPNSFVGYFLTTKDEYSVV